jgi:hypothetical protein
MAAFRVKIQRTGRGTDKREFVISWILAGFREHASGGAVERALSDLDQPVDLSKIVHELLFDVVHPPGV